MLAKFSTISQIDYKKLDKEIGDILHQVYRDKLGGTAQVAAEIFKVLDLALSSKKSIMEAKNYKKLLSAIQKSKLLHPSETAALFDKVNRFITDKAMKKEQEIIKKEVKETVMLSGPVKKVENAEDTVAPLSFEKEENKPNVDSDISVISRTPKHLQDLAAVWSQDLLDHLSNPNAVEPEVLGGHS